MRSDYFVVVFPDLKVIIGNISVVLLSTFVVVKVLTGCNTMATQNNVDLVKQTSFLIQNPLTIV